MKKKVAIFTDTFAPQTNGVVNYISQLVEELQKENMDVIVIAPGEKTQMVMHKGAKVYYFKGKSLFFYPGYYVVRLELVFPKIMAIIEMENPDIYSVQDAMPVGVVGAILANKFQKPLVGIYHTLHEEYMAHLSKGKYKKLVNYLFGKPTWPYFRLFYNACGFTISPGNELAKVLKKHKINNVRVIPNGIDFKRVSHINGTNIRKKYKIPSKSTIFLYLGRVSLEKRMDVLLKAYKEVESKDNYLLVVGSGPDLERTKSLAKHLNIKNITFTGYVDDSIVGDIYHSSDVFVTASDTETFGLVAIEAIAAGKPVIGPDKMGIKDLVKDGYNGFQFKSGDHIDMSQKMSKLLLNKNLTKRLSTNAKKDSKNYTPQKTFKKTIELYKKTKKSSKRRKKIISQLSKKIKRDIRNSYILSKK